jgi:hypothetical protein
MTHWTVRCKEDPRFDMEGEAYGLIGSEKAMNEAIVAKAKELGISDEDLDKLTIEVSACKD